MKEWFCTRVKETGHLDRFFGDIFEIADDVLRLPYLA
jgi:hypothetical protein